MKDQMILPVGHGCKFVWTVGSHARRLDAMELIQSVKSARRVSNAQIAAVERAVTEIEMSTELAALVAASLTVARKRPTCDRALSSFVELVAGIDYAGTGPEIGNLRLLRNAYAVTQTPSILEELCNYVEDCLARRSYRMLDSWFNLRVRIMDAYALSVACGSPNPLVIYYAGSRHTENFASHMKTREGARTTLLSHEVFSQLGDRESLLHTEQLHWNNKTIILLGENHQATDIKFAHSLLQLLRGRCSRGTRSTFMIERHQHNEKDVIQQAIMCNMPTCALHRTRCDIFFDAEKDECTSLDTVFVDSRHVDCGFLRREIFDAAAVDDDFFKKSIRFQKRALRSIQRYVGALLER